MNSFNAQLLAFIIGSIIVATLVNALPYFQSREWLVPSIAFLLILSVAYVCASKEQLPTREVWIVIAIAFLVLLLWLAYGFGVSSARTVLATATQPT